MSRPVNRFLDRRLKDRTTVRAEGLKARLLANHANVRDFLTLQILETTFVAALVGIVAGILFAASNFTASRDLDPTVWVSLSVAAQAISILGSLMIVRIAGDAIRVSRSLLPDLTRLEPDPS